MKFLVCVISLCAFANFLDPVKADKEQDLLDELKKNDCILKSVVCEKQMVTKVTVEEILGLCNAKPLPTTSSKCMIECQMRQNNWLNDSGFQKDKYLDYMKHTSLGSDPAYVEAAEKVADLCKDKKAPSDDRCETAYIIIQCLQDEGDKVQRINLGYDIFYVNPFFFDFE